MSMQILAAIFEGWEHLADVEIWNVHYLGWCGSERRECLVWPMMVFTGGLF